jgi:hypothetical protein
MIILTINENIKKAHQWCKETFGEIPLVENPYWRKNLRYHGMIDRANNMRYDEKNARWIHRMSKKGKFYFKDTSDAVMFRLRWM